MKKQLSELLPQESKDRLCEELNEVAKGNLKGNYFINPAEAARKLRNGISLRRVLSENEWIYREDDDILAFLFPLSQLRELIKKIDNHPRSADITGVRVYLAGRSLTIPDAFMIPVDSDNNDIEKVYYGPNEEIPDTVATTDTPVLNNSTPCPTVCP